MANSPVIVGIDLGTSTSEVAVLRDGDPSLLRNIAGSERGILPSVVGINRSGERVVGVQAASTVTARPDHAVAEVKRLMGTEERVRLGAESYRPQEISAMILKHLKDETEKFLGRPITEAVITVPAHFNDLQRAATRDAAEIAGLPVRRLINEPTAAALAYGIRRPGVEETLVVYDLGGGTFDVTVLELSEGILDVLASAGNSELGGKDFDSRVMEFLAAECERQTGVDLRSNRRRMQKLKHAAKRAKEALSQVERTFVALEYIGGTPDDPIDFEYELTRQHLESLIRDLVESTRHQLDEALAAKNLSPRDIDAVLLAGGSTRIPLVRRFVTEYFPGVPLRTDVDPDEVVSLGAAILSGMEAHLIDPHSMVITDVSPWTFGVGAVMGSATNLV